MRLRASVLVAALLCISAEAHAQGCATTSASDAERVIENLGHLFYDAEAAETRGAEIEPLDPATQPGSLVQDDSVCTALASRMVAMQRAGNLRWQGEQVPEHTILIFQFGPYYVGIIRESVLPSPGALMPPTGRGTDMIFRASDLEFLLGVV